ncbi:MAG: hypothetical protein GOV00_02715 [Candidatus Altiarchaeota archaeon]|nr:hypothetical protein [Candidatus Altiarchaeota archaeon]
MAPLLGMKFAVSDKDVFLNSVSELEGEGIIISGFEVHTERRNTPEEIADAIDFVRSGFSPKFEGIHPPFPTYAENTFLVWDRISADLGLTYTVMHAAVSNDKLKLEHEVGRLLAQAKNTVFLENIPFFEKHYGAGSLPELAKLHSDILFDIPHTVYNFEKGFTKEAPLEQLITTFDHVKAIHVADNLEGMGAVPKGGGSELFQTIMKQAFTKPELLLIAEPTGGHHNNAQGHKDTCREIWRLWENARDKKDQDAV